LPLAGVEKVCPTVASASERMYSERPVHLSGPVGPLAGVEKVCPAVACIRQMARPLRRDSGFAATVACTSAGDKWPDLFVETSSLRPGKGLSDSGLAIVAMRWAERRKRTPDRTAGIAWLRAVCERLEPGDKWPDLFAGDRRLCSFGVGDRRRQMERSFGVR